MSLQSQQEWEFLALDVETANADLSSICQVGMAGFRNGEVIREHSILINPECYFDPGNSAIHGLTEADVWNAPAFREVAHELEGLLHNSMVVTHTHFDRTALNQSFARLGRQPPPCTWIDTARVARRTWSSVAQKGYGLANLAAMLNIEFKHHDALEDAKAAGKILVAAMRESGLDVPAWHTKLSKRTPYFGYNARCVDGNPDGPLYGEVLVFTGELSIPRDQATSTAVELGCAVKTAMSKKVTVLVVGDVDVTKLAGHSLSTKHRTALEMMSQGHPVRIIRETDFMSMLESGKPDQ